MTALDARETESRQTKSPLTFSDPCVAAIPIEIRDGADAMLTDVTRPIMENYLAVLAKQACDESIPVSKIVLRKRNDMDGRGDYPAAYFVLSLTSDQTFDFMGRAEEPVENWVRTLTPEQDRILERDIHVSIVRDGYVF